MYEPYNFTYIDQNVCLVLNSTNSDEKLSQRWRTASVRTQTLGAIPVFKPLTGQCTISMYRNGSDLQKAETCHMVMWFGGSGGAWLIKKEQKKQTFTEKNVKINASKKVDKGTRLYIYLTVVGDCVTGLSLNDLFKSFLFPRTKLEQINFRKLKLR